MKKIKTLFIALQFIGSAAFGQTESKEELAAKIQAFRNETYKAVEAFLNASNNVQNRIAAVEAYPFIYDEAQIAQARKLVLDESQDPRLRATALRKIVNAVPQDQELGSKVISWFQNPKTPQPLRDESLKTLEALSFSGFTMYEKRQELMAALRTIVRDPNIEYRRFAFNFLLAHGDSFGQSVLIDQLEKNKSDLLPQAEAIRVLTLNPHGDYLPTVFKVFQRASDPETKVEAIAALGNYQPAKRTIIAVLKDKKQSKQVRSVALGAINANYPAEFAAQAQSLLIDDKESDDLKVAAINMEKYRRKSNKGREKKADDFDRAVKRLKDNGKSAPLREAGEEYIEAVDPAL